MTEVYSDIYGDLYSAYPVVGSWSGSYSETSALPPVPGTASLQVDVANVAGDWMIAVIAWRCPPGYPAPDFTVGDDVHNWWEPLSPSAGSVSPSSGLTRCSIWIAPAARAASFVLAAPSAYSPAFAMTVYDVTGILPWVVTSAATARANNAATLTRNLGAPSAQSVIFAASGSDNVSDSIALAGSGWSTVTTASSDNGVDGTADIVVASAWQVTSGSVSATWSTGTAVNLSAVTGGPVIAAAALTSLNPAWPVMLYETAPNGGLQASPDGLTWTSLAGQTLSLEPTQGRQYETGQLATGEGTAYLDNPMGNLVPPGTGSLAGIDSGTPIRVRSAWQGGPWQVQFSGNGSTGSAYISTGQVFALSAGQPASASAWLGVSPSYSPGATLAIAFCNNSGGTISTVTSAYVSTAQAALATASTQSAPSGTTHAAVLVQASGTPASSVVISAAAAPSVATAGAGYLKVPSGVTWLTGNGASAATLAAFSPSRFGPPDITPWYVPFNGFIERLPQQWDDLLRGYTEATLNDAWFGANSNPQPILITEILNDIPRDGTGFYWPCTDAAGAALASNLAPGSNVPLYVTESKYGTAGGKQAFGQNSSALLGAQQTLVVNSNFQLSNQAGMWGQTLGSGATAYQGSSLVATSSGFPQPAGGTTVEFWFQTVSPFNTSVDNFIAAGWSSGRSYYTFLIYLDIVDGHLLLSTAGSSPASPDFTILSSTDYLTGTPPLTQVALAYTSTSYTAYVNGSEVASGAWDAPVKALTTVSFNGTAGSTYSQGYWSGYAGQCAVFPFLLPANRIRTHYEAGVNALAGEPSQNRIERLLQAGGATGRRVILKASGQNVTNVVSCQDIPGQPVSSSIDNITGDLLPGMFFIAPTGDMVSYTRQYVWGQQPKWVLGENRWAGEIQYKGDITFDYDPTRVENQIQLTQLDNQDIIVPSVTAIETASQRQYSTISNLATGYLEGDATQGLNYGPGLYDLANWLATTYRKPALRLTAVTVDASEDPTRWPFVLGASAGDVVQVNRRPPSSGNTVISVTGRITQTARPLKFSTGGVAASVTCIIDTAPEVNALTLDSVTNGPLSGSNLLAW